MRTIKYYNHDKIEALEMEKRSLESELVTLENDPTPNTEIRNVKYARVERIESEIKELYAEQ